ncbi:plasmid partitioning protein RepB C-terminal domain-containing protein [Burkholderia savannae]|uniref:plasmid partitioning protein RepB C-terminal domain-containing protein n=1 Tax=Burkholderia savannae TaxID=1637837 RepID=UPI0009E7E85B|nr:plasmid partitioning protein RepB C-terminal domain-containing protein [Burkholderia savannae]
MKPFRQIEAAEMMIAANKFTKSYAEMILVTMRTDALTDKAKPKKQEEISPEDISRMEAERSACNRTVWPWKTLSRHHALTRRGEGVHYPFAAQREHPQSPGAVSRRPSASAVATIDAIAADNRALQRA